MGKITFYCNICAGPLSDWELRKRSMVRPDELAHVCFDDDCDCGYESGASNDEGDRGDEEDDVGDGDRAQNRQEEGDDDPMVEQNSEEDLARHDSYCNYRRGYWGDILTEGDVEWLSEACMLRMRGFDDEEEGEDEDEDAPSRYPSGVNPGDCYITHCGSYDAYDGLSISRTGEDFYPNQDGFMLHSKCWSMLNFVFAITRPEDGRLDHRRVYQTMLGKLADQNDIYIDWGDERLYGGTEEFAEQEWVPVPGYEWLVADPHKDSDFFELVRASTNRGTGSEPESLRFCGYTPIAVSDDPFARLPIEVHHMILELLPAKSVLNSFLSSRVLCASSAGLPQSFWKSRIFTDMPWAVRPSLLMSISRETGRVDSKVLLQLLRKAGAAPSGGRNARYEAWLSLKNRRRIWKCCEGILDVMKIGRNESGCVSRDLEALTSSRIARIRRPELREMGKLVNGETYFRPTILDQPPLRSLSVYFSEQMSVVGLEWQLEGETAGRFFGNRGAGMQSVALPQDLVITGIVLSLGSASRSEDKHRAIRGFGVLSADDDYRFCVKLGRWADGDIVHVFHPAKTQPDATIVGIAGQYSGTAITQFGILTADVINKTPPTVTPIISNLDIYTRWYSNYIPPPSKNIQLQVRHGILGFPLPEISPFDPPVLENPAQYIDLRGRQIASIQTFYPLGQNKEFGGFRIDFEDGSHEVVHKEEDDPGFHYLKEVVTFDVEAKEVIKKLICYFDSNPSRTTPSVLHGIELITSKNRKLSLGWLDAHSEDYRRDSYVRRGESVIGLHFGIKAPVIESIGLAVSSS
ncbi:hypothetical protein BJX66DRAFT_86866 [Aspergillus keveii]|uniref:F-box domain-containing protein n=1 Tax=Aspergillus keveii TaxID=714993 RepID=A0ABR4GEW6_9EURO